MANLYEKSEFGRISKVIYQRWSFIFGAILILSVIAINLYFLLMRLVQYLPFVFELALIFLWIAILLLVLFVGLVLYKLIRLFKDIKKVGSTKLYLKVNKAKKLIIQSMVDVLAINTMKQTKYFKVPAVAIAISDSNSWQISIEKLAGMRDIDLVRDTINSALVNDFEDYAVVVMSESKDGTKFLFELEDVNDSKKIVVSKKNQLENKEYYQLKVQQNVMWDISKAPHALIAGDSGTGKTATLMSFLAQFMVAGAEIKVIDPKNEFIFLENILSKGAIVRNFDDVLELLEEASNLMNERNLIIAERVKNSKKIGLTGADIGMRPLVIVIDEVGSLVAGVDRKELVKFNSYLTKLVQMGRSSLTNVILTTQQPNSQIISTAIRDQLNFRVLMGKPSQELKQMVFGSGVDLATEFIEPYTGYYVLAGQTIQPSKFYGLDLFENNLNSIDLYRACYRRGQTKQFNY